MSTIRGNLAKSKKYFEKCWEYMPGGTHYNFADPDRPLVIPFNKGKGSRVWDLDGNEHLDLFCKFGALLVGHGNEKFNNSLKSYIDKILSVDMCDMEAEVSELLVDIIPCAQQVRYCLSGTECIQNALRLARAYTGKNRFIRFKGHYHGNADNIIGGRLSDDLSYPIPVTFEGDTRDTAGRDPKVLEQQSFLLPWNDIEILEKTINAYANEIAAIIMEPISINGGGIMPKEGYLEKAKEICEKNNILLIFDEVITGFRVGLRGAQGILGVTPHIAVYGKSMSGGAMPVSLIASSKEIMKLYRDGKAIHAGTFNGYPLGLASVKATLDTIMNDPQCYARMGDYLSQIASILVESARENGIPMVVQGWPTALVFHAQENPVEESGVYSMEVLLRNATIREVCKHYGIHFSPVSRLYSTTMMNDDDVTYFREHIGEAMDACKKVLDSNFAKMFGDVLEAKRA